MHVATQPTPQRHSIVRRLGPPIVAAALAVAALGIPSAAAPGPGPAIGTPGWSEPIPVTDDSQLWELHDIAVSGDTIHLIYVVLVPDTTYEGTLYYRRSTDGGRHWSDATTLFRTGATYTQVIPNLAIAAEGPNVIVAFRSRHGDDAVLFARSSRDGGRTWGSRTQLASDTTDYRMGIPAAAATPAGLFVGWSERSSGAIRLRRSLDDGRTFEPAIRLGTTRYSFICTAGYRDGMLGLAAEGDTVLAVWSDLDPGVPTNSCEDSRIVTRRSFDGGATFDAKRLVWDGDTGGWPEIVTNGHDTLITLQEWGGNGLVLRSADLLATVTARTFAGMGQPDVALRPNGEAILAYPRGEWGDTGPIWAKLLVRTSDDAGRSWGPAVTVIPRGPYPWLGAVNVDYVGARPVILTGWTNADETELGTIAVVGPPHGGR